MFQSASFYKYLRGLHSPGDDFHVTVSAGLMSDAFIPRFLSVTVKNDKMSFIHASANIHVFGSLAKPLLDHLVEVTSSDLEFKYDSLNRTAISFCERFPDKKVGAFPPQTIFQVNVSFTVYDSLKECLQQELRPCFGVVEFSDPGITVLPKELLKVQQFFVMSMLLSSLMYQTGSWVIPS